MAELIYKDELIQIIDTASDDLSERLKAVFIDIVAELPATTEAEIRAKAFSDLIEKIRENLELPHLALDYIRIFAEKLKEE